MKGAVPLVTIAWSTTVLKYHLLHQQYHIFPCCSSYGILVTNGFTCLNADSRDAGCPHTAACEV